MSSVTEVDEVVERTNILWDKEEIRACYARYARGVDRLDSELVKSVFHDEATFNSGSASLTVDDFLVYCEDQRDKRDATHHYATNFSIEIDGDTAHVEAYYLAVVKVKEGKDSGFVPPPDGGDPGDEVMVSGGRYIDRFERRDGQWRIALRWSVPEYQFIADGSRMDAFVVGLGRNMGKRGKDDISYMRPLAGTGPID